MPLVLSSYASAPPSGSLSRDVLICYIRRVGCCWIYGHHVHVASMDTYRHLYYCNSDHPSITLNHFEYNDTMICIVVVQYSDFTKKTVYNMC
jgi:hypothetical protein